MGGGRGCECQRGGDPENQNRGNSFLHCLAPPFSAYHFFMKRPMGQIASIRPMNWPTQ
jgi:hypothetical protein